MIKISEFEIEESIVHILDVNCDEPILNDKCLDLLDSDMKTFLIKHIEKILKDEELFEGRFCEVSSFLDGVEKFFNSSLDLIEISKEMSINFFDVMKQINSSSSFDLLFLKLSTDVGSAICMIKLDYIKNYVHKIDYIENKIQIDIVPQFVSFSSAVQKINKGTIFLKNLNGYIDLFYIDGKSKDVLEKEDYFVKDFLNCIKISSNYEKTKNLISTSEKWARKNIKDDAEMAFLMRESLRDKLINEDDLNINKVAKDIFKDDSESMDDFVSFMESNGVNGNLTVDKDYVNKKYERSRLKIDKDIDLYIDKDSL